MMEYAADPSPPRRADTYARRASRRKSRPAQARGQGCKNKKLRRYCYLCSSVPFLVGMVVVCSYFGVFASAVPPETQRWSQSILAAILSGTISFMVGRKMGK